MPKKSKPPAKRGGATNSNSNKKRPRKFKVQIKQRDPIADSEAAYDQPIRAGLATTKPFEQCMIEYVGAAGLPEVSAKYVALCGADRPVAKPLVCDRVLMKEVELGLFRDLRDHLAQSPSDVGLQVTRLGVVPGDAAVISVMDARKPKGLYERAKVDGIAVVRFCAVPQTDAFVPGIAVDLVTIVFGQDVKSKLATAAARSRGPDGFGRSPYQWFEGDDEDYIDDVEMALTNAFSPPFHGLPRWDPFGDLGAQFDAQCVTGLRATITLMCRSQLPLKKALIGFGGGKRMVKRTLTDVDDSLKSRCKAGPAIVHQDEIPHFWSAELRRLGWGHISVPIVKLH